jgi:hypothetical protein
MTINVPPPVPSRPLLSVLSVPDAMNIHAEGVSPAAQIKGM